ncbi:transposable element p transposase [Plakobranchus ocellatus]|uniref:Transposable element p transposase n=1 Tax=Plakobranchus ocellatus TaxID=259542 RepID=A0AAV4ACK2_9GAST|nr:transposable element p transposase [Plakobranchus ocellatus]
MEEEEGEEGEEEENEGRKRRRRRGRKSRMKGTGEGDYSSLFGIRRIIFCTHLRRHCSMHRVRLFPMFLLLASICPARPACSPAEEGEQTTLSCTVNTAKTCNTDTKIEWFVDSYTNGRILGCSNAGCGSFFRDIFSSTDSGSTLTISKVSRTVPAQFSMETRWNCRFCNGPDVTACNMLEIYAKPEKRSCTVTENIAVPGDIESVTVSCSTTKVYPEAKCSFERSASGGLFITIKRTPTYNHTELTGSPVYYRSECSVDVPVAELGEGTHSFSAFIYPDVTDGIDLITTTIASATVTLTLPGAPSYTCSPEMIQGYFNGKSARCTCSLTSDGYPKGQVQWYRGSQTVPGVSGGVVDLSFDSSNLCNDEESEDDSKSKDHLQRYLFLLEQIKRASLKRRAFTMMSGGVLKPYISNPVLPEERLFFLFDTVDLFKCIRNNWLAQKYLEKTFLFPPVRESTSAAGKSLTQAKFSHLRKLYNAESLSTLKLAPALNLKSLNPTPTEKQSVNLMLRIFDRRNVTALQQYGPTWSLDTSGTREFLNLIIQLWNMLNVKHPLKGIRHRDDTCKPVHSMSDDNIATIQSSLAWLEKWKGQGLKAREGV